MRTRNGALAAGILVVAAAATGGVLALSSGAPATPTAEAPAATTAKVERGTLSDTVSIYGTLTFRARSNGTPYVVINRAPGTYTQLPSVGDTIDCGDELYRVDDSPVLLLCGTVPAYRSLQVGEIGTDVRQLNLALHSLGYDAGSEIDPNSMTFTEQTEKALEALQRSKGVEAAGSLEEGDVVFLPEAVRIASVTTEPGGPAELDTQVLDATSDTPEVQLALDPSQRNAVKTGNQAQITLPDNTVVTGTVARFGSVTQAPAGQNAGSLAVTVAAYIALDDPGASLEFEGAPVQVDITTEGVEDALSVPVTALVGQSGGGFAVEVVRSDGSRELVAVTLGLFDTSAGRVQVDGRLHEGDQVVVPSF